MYQNTIKIVLDKLVALMSILILTPFFVFLVFLLYFFQQQKVFFVQIRVGKDKMPFKIYKFQTMSEERDSEGNLLPDDARITTLGKFFRKTSLDELPQLFNVLVGDMSFVGPRPALFNQNDLIALRIQYGVDALLPGLTGWAQINGRDEISIPEKVALDHYYLEHQSLIFDVKILFQTFFGVVLSKGISH